MTDVPDAMIPDEQKVIGADPQYSDGEPDISQFSFADVGLLCPDCGHSTVFGVPTGSQHLRCPKCALGRELTRREKDRIHPRKGGAR